MFEETYTLSRFLFKSYLNWNWIIKRL